MMNENTLSASISRKIAGSTTRGWYRDVHGCDVKVPCISFMHYMEACLYDSEFGYYRSGSVRIGREGDFYTSSGIGSVLAQVLAKFALDYAAKIGEPVSLIEWGAGTGRLSVQMAEAGRRQRVEWGDKLRSIIVEDHPAHRNEATRAAAELSEQTAIEMLLLFSEEAWASEWLKKPVLLIANELLDAFPVHRVQKVEGQLLELGVAWSEHKGFYEVYMPLTDSRIEGWLIRDGIELKEGQQTEIHAVAADFLSQLGSVVGEGRLLLIDYGHESAEYAAEHRMLGTLMCYYRHQAGASPYTRIGEQDMTSHVPFTFIRQEAERNGWEVTSYTTQKQFLIEQGVLELLQNHDNTNPFSDPARANRAIRQLLLSDQMSETFKVMVLDKK